MKKLFAAFAAVVLAATMAAPTVADALWYQSPIGDWLTAPEGASAGIVGTDEGGAQVTNAHVIDKPLEGYQQPAEGGKYVGTFVFSIDNVHAYNEGATTVMLGLRGSVGKEYEGRTVTAYVQRMSGGDGGPAAPVTATVDSWGTFEIPFSVSVNSSWGVGFSINIEPAQAPAGNESPIYDTVKSDEGTSLTVIGNDNTTGSIESVVATDKIAANYKDVSGNVVLGSFEIKGDAQNFILKYTVDKKYAGMSALLYVEHEDGTMAVQSQRVAEDGTVTFAMDKLSVYTIVVDTTSASTGTGTATGTKKPVANKDTSSKSPVTGARSNAGTAAVVAAVALAGAAGCAALAHRKVNGR